MLGTRTVFDTVGAVYVWEWPFYPRYYVPLADLDPAFLVAEDPTEHTEQGPARLFGLRADGLERPGSVRVFGPDALPGLDGMARVEWDALDAWYEEREQIFVHPRNPYVRLDALRSDRHVRVELDGVLLAESRSPVLVFETGLPTRYYLDRQDVDFARLEPSDTITSCPYKGRTSAYWSVITDDARHADLAWSYDFPTRQLLPIAGLVAFYDEQVDVTVDGVRQPRPQTHFG
ncbi:DUF427 domain-containing protein [uncultured Jatrophihabitans sp.]|uniref:DUF427 domain-containing protein n=1 Tax=uncultured Jatrophihabitans sp. TaxID=1610747 RepID=UPI0035CA2E29